MEGTVALDNPLSDASSDRLYRKITLQESSHSSSFHTSSPFLDRINIGFAQLQMKQDLGFSDAIYGLAAGMFAVGYVLMEVPSNLMLEKVGARRTFSPDHVVLGRDLVLHDVR